MAERYYIDERVGCIAVRDRENTPPDYPGLHHDTPGVVWYAHGFREDGRWSVLDEDRQKAKKVCDDLNTPPDATDLLIEHDWRAERGDEVGAARCLLRAAGFVLAGYGQWEWWRKGKACLSLSRGWYDLGRAGTEEEQGTWRRHSNEPLLPFVRRAIVEITGRDVLTDH